jgi:hypothetical protein
MEPDIDDGAKPLYHQHAGKVRGVVNSLARGLRAHHAGTTSSVCGVFTSIGPSDEEKRQ